MGRTSLMSALVALTIIAGGCANRDKVTMWRDTGRVTHVVVCWLKEPGNAEARRQLTAASQAFRDIPGVVDVIVGRPLPSDRPVVDSTFDLSIVFLFEDPNALRRYEQSPEHQKALLETVRPLVERYVVYDAWEKIGGG